MRERPLRFASGALVPDAVVPAFREADDWARTRRRSVAIVQKSDGGYTHVPHVEEINTIMERLGGDYLGSIIVIEG